jgi:hypothetical protein
MHLYLGKSKKFLIPFLIIHYSVKITLYRPSGGQENKNLSQYMQLLVGIQTKAPPPLGIQFRNTTSVLNCSVSEYSVSHKSRTIRELLQLEKYGGKIKRGKLQIMRLQFRMLKFLTSDEPLHHYTFLHHQ